MATGSSERFSDRVRDYVRYRPDYPAAAIDLLAAELPLRPGITVADIGAGTGILTRQLADTGASVVAVDPNEHMLDAARDLLRDHADVSIVVGTAETTGLADQSVDAITAGQAFHWFDHVLAREEFLRILRPGGQVALIWNAKAFDSSGFLADYERLLEEHVPEFAQVRHETTGEPELLALFGDEPRRLEFPHQQHFDWDGVLGRVMSSSYAPRPGHPIHDAFVDQLRTLFDEHAVDGAVTWPYTTTLYLGPLR